MGLSMGKVAQRRAYAGTMKVPVHAQQGRVAHRVWPRERVFRLLGNPVAFQRAGHGVKT